MMRKMVVVVVVVVVVEMTLTEECSESPSLTGYQQHPGARRMGSCLTILWRDNSRLSLFFCFVLFCFVF